MLYSLDNLPIEAPFPPVEHAETEPDGLLAVGGDLSPTRLLNAYCSGIFPWYSDDQPILWWSPNPRAVIYPQKIKISRSLRKILRNKPYHVTYDQAFSKVMLSCAKPRQDSPGTWITDDMHQAYVSLHQRGYAHSVEVWIRGELVGGLYGVAIGKVFFGESMFSSEPNTSKVALVKLSERLLERGYGLIDCQVSSPHLLSLGAEEISREHFCIQLTRLCREPTELGPWMKNNND